MIVLAILAIAYCLIWGPIWAYNSGRYRGFFPKYRNSND